MSNAVNFVATDLSGQHAVKVNEFPGGATVGEMVRELVGQMGLLATNEQHQAYTYHARLDRAGRHLHASEIIGDVLREGDEVVLHPNIDAGAR